MWKISKNKSEPPLRHLFDAYCRRFFSFLFPPRSYPLKACVSALDSSNLQSPTWSSLKAWRQLLTFIHCLINDCVWIQDPFCFNDLASGISLTRRKETLQWYKNEADDAAAHPPSSPPALPCVTTLKKKEEKKRRHASSGLIDKKPSWI